MSEPKKVNIRQRRAETKRDNRAWLRRRFQENAHYTQERAEIKRQLLKLVETAIDRDLGKLREGQGLGLHFHLEVVNSDFSFASEPDGRTSPEATEWRKTVYERDDYTCQDCGERGGKLHAHHAQSWAAHPELRYDPDNGITLCVECHANRHPNQANLIRNARYHHAAPDKTDTHAREEEAA